MNLLILKVKHCKIMPDVKNKTGKVYTFLQSGPLKIDYSKSAI